MDKNRLQKLAGLLKEEEDFDLSDNPVIPPKYRFRVGEKVELYRGDTYSRPSRPIVKILDRKPELTDDMETSELDYGSIGSNWESYMGYDEQNPWYLFVHTDFADEGPLWWPQSELIGYGEVEAGEEGTLDEVEDFDLSDNPLQGPEQFYKRHYAILNNEDEEIVGFKDVVNENDFFNRVNRKRKESPDFKHAYDFLIENEPFFCEKYPGDEFEGDLTDPDYILTFDEWANDVKASIANYREPLDEEEDFDLSDNPLHMPYKFEVGEELYDEQGDFNDEEDCVVVDRRSSLRKVEKDPVKEEYLEYLYEWVNQFESTFNKPWYLVKWLGINEGLVQWYPQSYLIRQDDLKARNNAMWEDNPLREEEDFDLSDNPVPNKIIGTYKYEVPEFEIDLSDKGKVWRVDVEVEEIKYSSGKVEWKIKVTKVDDITGWPLHVTKYDPIEDASVFKYLENIIRTDKKVATAFDEAFDEYMRELYGNDEDDHDDYDEEGAGWDEWERNPDR